MDACLLGYKTTTADVLLTPSQNAGGVQIKKKKKKHSSESLNKSHCVTPITSTYVSVLERHWEEQEVTPTADEMRRSGYYQLVNQAVSLMGWER